MSLFGGPSGNGSAAGGSRRMRAEQGPLSLRERFGALRHLPRLFRLVWATSPAMTAANLALRLVRALQPVALLYVGKLVIDAVVRLLGAGYAYGGAGEWVWSGALDRLAVRGLTRPRRARRADVRGAAVALLDSLLGDRLTNAPSAPLMAHAATLHLAQFEDADFYDRLERARRQTTGRMVLMSQVLGQAQDIV